MPTNSKKMRALAERARKCKAWRWLPGMRVMDVDGDCGVIVHVVGQRLRISYGCTGSGRRWSDLLAWEVAHECSPDLADPCTLGCLLSLVRAAWSDPRACVQWARAPGCAAMWIVWTMANAADAYAPVEIARAPTEAEALVAALEAAPAR